MEYYSYVRIPCGNKEARALGSSRSGIFFYVKAVIIASLIVFLGLGIVGASLVGVSLAVVDQWSHQWNQGELIKDDVNSVVYDNQGRVLTVLHAEKNRTPVAFEQIPPVVKDAFLAVEDIRFYQHEGVDLRAIGRAVLANYHSGNYAEGASTITQQLVRIALLTPEKKMQRKLREMVIARELELRYTKDEIFNMYLNRLYFGHGAYGIQAAAQVYFGKSVEQLTLPEAALLAGLAKNPNGYSPYRYPDRAKQRRDTVLQQMWRWGLIDDGVYRQTKDQPVHLVGLHQNAYRHPYFVDYVLEYVLKNYDISEEQLYRGGLRIYTSLDANVQTTLEQTFAQGNNFPPSQPDQLVQGAMVILDAQTGYVKGLVGGRNYQARRGFNRAVNLARQPGSAIKPVAVYAPALVAGFPADYVLKDEPVNFDGYSPKNSDGRYRGDITMTTALQYSINTYAVKMLHQLGVDTGFNYAIKSGLPLVAQDKGLALALGGLQKGVAPLHMAAAFAPFANGGTYHPPQVVTRITDYRGVILHGKAPASQQVMSTDQAQIMTEMLTNVVEAGTGQLAAIPGLPVAGKTGTTQLPDLPTFRGLSGNKDAWFVGYSGKLVGAVWIGYDQTDANHYLQGVYGGTFPAQIWQKVMSKTLVGQ